jgi:2-methylcitrate dehydratase PrpD
MKPNRRKFIGSAAFAGIASTGPVRAAETTAAAKTPAPKDATLQLARYIVHARYEDLPAPVRKEAVRTLVNYVGCAVGGSRHETVDNAIAALAPFAGTGQATILGRKEKLDVLNASLMNGISSHVLDYDDTHLRTIIHPGGPVVSAILAYAEYKPVTGTEFLNAMVVGIEAECRIGNAVYPAHYDTGWHITGTVGPFGAAAAVGKLLGLNEQQMVWALGLAAAQPVGLREMFGSMTKSFHPGRAAQNGFTAALLAQKNYTSSDHGLEAKSGWLNVISTQQNWGEIVDNLGKSWEVSINTYKPFACGIVLHPTIDGCIQLRNANKLTADQTAKIDLQVHPLVLELTGKRAPKTGLESKFSVYHAAAAALVTGKGGDKQFSDQLALDPAVSALASRVTATVTPGIAEDQVRIAVTLKDGRRLEQHVEHAVGSIKNPMSDAALEGKFLDLADGVLPAAQARKLLDLCGKIETLKSAAEIARAGQG